MTVHPRLVTRVACAVACAVPAGCAADEERGATPTTGPGHTYAVMGAPIAGPPPLFTTDAPAPRHLAGAVSYRVGAGARYPAYLVRTTTGALCLYARGDDGVGGACSDGGGPDHGVVALGEVRADGGYVLSLVVPDDVAEVGVRGRAVKPVRNLVRVELPYGTTEVVFVSVNGDHSSVFTARRPPGRSG